MTLALLLASVFALAKPVHKHPDFERASSVKYAPKVGEYRSCTFRAKRDTRVLKTDVAKGEVIGGLCWGADGSNALRAVYRGGLSNAAGEDMFWAKRVDTGLIDLVYVSSYTIRVEHTAYDHAWSPVINGTSDAERSVVFLGNESGVGTYDVDVVGVDGQALGTLRSVTDIDDYRSAYIVSSTHEFGEVHQVVSIDGELLTPLLPSLERRGESWVYAVEDDLVLPVTPGGKLGRPHPRVKGFSRLGDGLDSAHFNVSHWEMPDGTVAYGLADKYYRRSGDEVYKSLEVVNTDWGGTYVFAEALDGYWDALGVKFPTTVYLAVQAATRDELPALVARAYAAGRADAAKRKEKYEADMRALDAKIGEELAKVRAAESARIAAHNASIPAWGPYRSCPAAYRDRHQLTADEAHHAVLHCHNTLQHIQWLELDGIYMALSAPVVQAGSSATSSAADTWRPRYQDQDAISRARFNADLDRYMRGASSYDPTDTDW